MHDLRNIWESGGGESAGGGVSRVLFGGHAFFLGEDMRGSKRVPVLMIPNVSFRTVKTAGFEICVRRGRVGFADAEEDFLQIRCLEGHLNAVFFKFVDEIAKRVEAGATPQGAIQESYELWKQFLLTERKGILGYQEMIGLWGELEVISVMLDQGCTPKAVISAWNGPLGADWDFRIPLASGAVMLEVKTSKAEDLSIRINNPRQLIVESGFAWLCCVKLIDAGAANGGKTVVDQIKAVATRLNAGGRGLELRAEFVGKIERLGYSPAHDDYYESFEFRKSEEIWLQVDALFPVIREKDINGEVWNRVSELNYRLSLAGLPTELRPAFKF